MTALPALDADDFSREPALLAETLRGSGACWIAGWPDVALQDALRDDLRRLQSLGVLSPAAVGRGDGRTLRSGIRGDATCWLDDPRCGDAARTLLARLDTVRTILNRTLFLGLVECEAHYAAYPAGGGYARHRDRFRDQDRRTLTLVLYLNDAWPVAAGGALRLYRDECAPLDVRPEGGTAVAFLADRFEHEVLPASMPRWSFTGWFCRRAR